MFPVRNTLSGVSCVIAIVEKKEGTPTKSGKSLSKHTAELSTGDNLGIFFFPPYTFLHLYLLFGKNISE